MDSPLTKLDDRDNRPCTRHGVGTVSERYEVEPRERVDLRLVHFWESLWSWRG